MLDEVYLITIPDIVINTFADLFFKFVEGKKKTQNKKVVGINTIGTNQTNIMQIVI